MGEASHTHQYNAPVNYNGPVNNLNGDGPTYIIQNGKDGGSVLPKWFCPYDEELKADRKRTFLYQATVSLIEQGKVFRGADVEKVKVFLNSNNVCLVKAPEGRGKTFLSRIVAFDFHAERKEVFFVDFTKIDDKYDQLERIKDVLNIWKNNKYTNYFLVLENVHACQKLSELIEVIKDWKCFDTEIDKGNVQFLLNTRPTDEGVDCFNEWEEVVELKPDREAIDKVIEIYFGEANGRQPFENEDSKKAFVNNICKEGDIRNGTNLRLLGYYLMTWLGDSSIEYVSDVNESKIIEKVKLCYFGEKIGTIDDKDLVVLLYFSSIFQFDVSLHRDIINHSKVFEYDILPNRNVRSLDKFVNLPYNFLIKRQGRYFMAHSFDAYFLCKAICDYRGDVYAKKTKQLVETFVNAILDSGNSRDFNKDFRLLWSGIIARKDEFKEVVFYLTREDMAERIINELYPGFVAYFFRPENHETPDPEALVEYYKKNIDWLKPVILGLEPISLGHLNSVFKKYLNKYLKYDFYEDIFRDPDDLDKYLSANYNVFQSDQLITAISELGSAYKEMLRKHYEANKNLLKPLFLQYTSTTLIFHYVTINKQLNISIVKDIFKDPDDLDKYLSANYNVFQSDQLIMAISKLGSAHKEVLKKHYDANKDLLKPSFLRKSSTKLSLLYNAFKNYMDCNIVEDIFEDLDELDKYLRTNYKVFQKDQLIMAISKLGRAHKEMLIKHYDAIKHLLKPSFLGNSSTRLSLLYNAFKNYMDCNIVEDIFEDLDELDKYLSANYKTFLDSKLIVAISKLGSSYKEVLRKHYNANKNLLKPLFLGLSPTNLTYIYIAFKDYLYYNIVKDIFEDPNDLEKYMRDNGDKQFVQDDALKAINELGDEHKRILNQYGAFNYFFYSFSKIGFCVKQRLIDKCWRKKVTFDVKRIKNNRFYFDGVSWAYIPKFVYVIKRDMTEETRQQSVDMVEAIIRIVLAKKNALSYATANDLAYFYANVASVDENISRKLMDEASVRADVENRLAAPSYTVGDLYLFDLFFSQLWCKAILEPRIINADNEQKKIIKTWYDELMRKFGDEEINSGTFLDYIHQKYYSTENPPTDAPLVGGV